VSEPVLGDFIVERGPDEAYHVERFGRSDTQVTFPDEAAAMSYAFEGARMFGYRVYRRSPEGWALLPLP
jgi:hypothetical protein